jgi:hypothetical protein
MTQKERVGGGKTMAYRAIPLDELVINSANDRHGELENDTAAIAWLFNNRESHMRNLAKDIVDKGGIYEPPLVWPSNGHYTVFDGNRRVTCLKLLEHPKRAPTTELQDFFTDLRKKWEGKFPESIQCQIEADRDRIDDILFRRHTGTQNGVGQSTWDDRMKSNFVNRTGVGGGLNVAEEIEKRLSAAGVLPGKKKIPRSTLNRLLSAEAFRNRLGFSIRKGKFVLTHEEPVVLSALRRVTDDLASQNITLNDVWDVDGKRNYLDALEREQVLPAAKDALKQPTAPSAKLPTAQKSPQPTQQPIRRECLIPNPCHTIAWAGRLQRHRAIWEELQFHLRLSEHPNAIAVLFRVLFELAVENYIQQTSLTTVKDQDKLATRAQKVAEDLHQKGKIDKKYLGVFGKLPQLDPLVSVDTMNRYVHSPNFNPSPDHVKALWDTLGEFVALCLNA